MTGQAAKTDDLYDLYRELILDHARSPRHFGRLQEATHTAQGINPLCGDKITVYVNFEGDLVKEVAFQGSGCAISQASASLLTESVRGKPKSEVLKLFTDFHEMVTDSQKQPELDHLGKLAVFSGVREFPMRVKCASLAWHTLKSALNSTSRKADLVTTE